jgi:type II secretory pathway pseudopilin PulG
MELRGLLRPKSDEKGMSLIELLASCGLIAFVIGLSVTPMIQMRKLEKKTEFQTALNTAHQIAIQKARNVTYLKQQLGLLPPPGTALPVGPVAETPIERCFGGRGTACAVAPVVDSFTFKQLNTYATESKITITTTCVATKCTNVSVQVATSKLSGAKDVDWKSGNALTASFSLPAVALASRQEIDFSSCVGTNKVITGIDYDTLIANCVSVTGNTTCTGVATAGPLSTVGQANMNDPANCQPTPTLTCPNGMKTFGLVGAPTCVDALACTDPLSANCSVAAAPPCVPNWQPTVDTQCNGAAFTQTDANNCPTSVPRPAVGTNPTKCAVGSCTLSGPVKWPNPITGPCSVANAAGSAAPGSAVSITNERLGYYGTLSTTCQNNAPAANAFNLATATSSCTPVVCSGIPATAQWSKVGLKSAVAGTGFDPVGPWTCSGPQTIVNSPSPGVLLSVQADPAAKTNADNTAVGPVSGNASFICDDPGPVTAPRSGVLKAANVTCAMAAGRCDYRCIFNFDSVTDEGSLEIGETMTNSCYINPVQPSKAYLECTPRDGAFCDVTHPTPSSAIARCTGPDSGTPSPCPSGQVMGYSWVVEFFKAPDTITWDPVGATSGFSASIAAADADRLALCDAFQAQLPRKQNCGPMDPPMGPKCGILNPGALPGAAPPPEKKNVCTFTSDTASIGSGEMRKGQSWTIASQASKGGFSCVADPSADVKCVFWTPTGDGADSYTDSCSSITLGDKPITGTGSCEVQTFSCVAK